MIVEQFTITVSRDHLNEWKVLESREATICLAAMLLCVGGFFLTGTAVSFDIWIAAKLSNDVFSKELPQNVGAALMIVGIAMLILYGFTAGELVYRIAGGALEQITLKKRRIIHNYGRYPVEEIGTEHASGYARYILRADGG